MYAFMSSADFFSGITIGNRLSNGLDLDLRTDVLSVLIWVKPFVKVISCRQKPPLAM